jgi:ABC-type dipeptide/oligopeptide/nickel transport system permease component
VQYWVFISKAVQGDFGRSIKGQMPVIDMLKERLPHSLKLGAVALGIAVLLAFPLGVVAAVKGVQRSIPRPTLWLCWDSHCRSSGWVLC